MSDQIKREFRRNEPVCQQVIGRFQMIANKARFRLLCVLARGEFCVQDLTNIVSEGKDSNISQQLKILALAGVIEKRREGKWILYRLADKKVAKLIEFLRQQYLGS